jgi:hypothetical protein
MTSSDDQTYEVVVNDEGSAQSGRRAVPCLGAGGRLAGPGLVRNVSR